MRNKFDTTASTLPLTPQSMTDTRAINQQCCFQSCAFIKIYLLQPRNISQERERRFLGESGYFTFSFFTCSNCDFLRPRRQGRKPRRRKTKHAEPSVQFTWQTTSATRSLAAVYKGKKTLANALAVLLAWHAVASFWCALVWRVNGWRGGSVTGGGSSCFG